MTDIVLRLRCSVTQARAVDRAELLAEAADEIERLRAAVTLSPLERQALSISGDVLEAVASNPETSHAAVTGVEVLSAALAQLLARMA